jgi:hypothetical protein
MRRSQGTLLANVPVNQEDHMTVEDETQTGDDSDNGNDMQNFDTTMAAGASSGAAGVANAELGTSGTPASGLLTPEELAQVEALGGTGMQTGKVDAEQLDRLFGASESTGQP